MTPLWCCTSCSQNHEVLSEVSQSAAVEKLLVSHLRETVCFQQILLPGEERLDYLGAQHIATIFTGSKTALKMNRQDQRQDLDL